MGETGEPVVLGQHRGVLVEPADAASLHDPGFFSLFTNHPNRLRFHVVVMFHHVVPAEANLTSVWLQSPFLEIFANHPPGF